MPSDLQVSNIRDLTNANSAISIASDGQVTIEQNNPTITLGTNTRLPQGSIANVHCSTPSSITTQTINAATGIVPTGSQVFYTPSAGARYVIYQYNFGYHNNSSSLNRSIIGFSLKLGSTPFLGNSYHIVGEDQSGNIDSSYMLTALAVIDLVNLDSYFSGTSSHSWKTNAGTSSHSPSADTLKLDGGWFNANYPAVLHKHVNSEGTGNALVSPTTIIYSVM